MARARNQKNGRLEEAMVMLIQNQASFVQNQTSFLARMAQTDKEIADLRRRDAELRQETAERFRRIEAILLEHSRILQALPDAIRDKIGFKPETPRST